MKLAKLQIENFRHLGTREKPFTLDFTDAFGSESRFHPCSWVRTASGKTTVLDAIALALGRTVGMAALRPDFKVSPRTVVRRGALHAEVTCWLRFSPGEIAATRDVFRLAEIAAKVPDAPEMKLTWTYPAPRKPSEPTMVFSNMLPPGQTLLSGNAAFFYPTGTTVHQPGADYGVVQCEPDGCWVLLHGRDQAARLLATGRADWSWFHRVGGVFTFDQERTGLGKTVSRQIRNIFHGTAEAAQENEELRTTDPRTILIDLALQHLVPSIAAKGESPDEFQLLQEQYSRVCAPRRIVGAVRDERGEFDVYFNDGENEYSYGGLSSGEKNVLLLLIRFVAERMHQSVVLIDELELNQHLIWQRRLVHMVPRMGEGNQIIATTHSPYLRGAVAPSAVCDLGDLEESHQAGGE